MSELREHSSSQTICSQFGSSVITAISPKILSPHNNLCVSSDNRSHCYIGLVADPGVWLRLLDFTLHCKVRSFVHRSIPIRELFCKTVWSGGQKAIGWLLRTKAWMTTGVLTLDGMHSATPPPPLMDQSGCKNSGLAGKCWVQTCSHYSKTTTRLLESTVHRVETTCTSHWANTNVSNTFWNFSCLMPSSTAGCQLCLSFDRGQRGAACWGCTFLHCVVFRFHGHAVMWQIFIIAALKQWCILVLCDCE